jgi:2-methylcitrate dehydratase PrpD
MGGAEFSYESSLATHSIAGTFGAAAAAACAVGLDARQMRWALDYTAQQSSGIFAWRRDTDHIEKAFVFGGMPARSGVTSALLVQSGWNGVDDIFSGADNFFQAYAPKAQPARLVEKLGERYEIARTDIKKWTVGSPIQGPLDAVEAISGKQPFAADQVRLAPSVAAVVDNRDIPDICLQHMIAVMLVDKTVSFQAAHDKPRMQEPAVLRQRAKVNLVRDEELSKVLPLRVTIVEIDLTDGNRLSERVAAVRGRQRNPMSRAEVIEKARDLIVPRRGRDCSDVARFFHEAQRAKSTISAEGPPTACRCLETVDMLAELGYKLRYNYRKQNWTDDHICYITDLSMLHAHYPNWRLEYDLPRIIEEIVRRNARATTA